MPGAERCLWWDTAPPFTPPAAELPARCDVAIIGAGYTGLSAARALSRGGATVVVLEREQAGWGASSRNGGFVLPGYKLDLAELAERYGRERARLLHDFSVEGVRHLECTVEAEQIACDYHRPGAVSLAARAAHLSGLERSARLLQDFGAKAELLDARSVREEIGSERYYGGLLESSGGAVHPAKLVRGLARAAVRAGALLLERSPVLAIRRTGTGLSLRVGTGGRTLAAREVLVASNGYTDGAAPALRRRVVPLGSYILATEPLGESLQRRLIPHGRVLSDTKNLLFYFRLSPDGRLLFGGRAAFSNVSLERIAGLLRTGMVSVFPELAGVAPACVWGGQVGVTLRQMPHAGRRDGIHYALGYCGHGVAMATYLGDWMGELLLGRRPLPPIAELPFPVIPCYEGRPWFLPLVGAWYRLADRLG